MTLAIRVKREQVILPACRDGADFGVPQLLLAIDVETGRRLIWLPGHKCWFSIGRRKYYPGELIVDGVGDRTFPGTRLELRRTPIARSPVSLGGRVRVRAPIVHGRGRGTRRARRPSNHRDQEVAPMTDEDPKNTGAVVWRDDGAARGRLVRVEVHQDKRDAEASACRLRSWERPNMPRWSVRVHRRDLRVDGARCVLYSVVVREQPFTVAK